MIKHILTTAAISAAALAVSTNAGLANDGGANIKRVLLISIDGMHALDFINCASKGTCPNLAGLKATGANYLEASTSKPSELLSGIDGHRERRIAAHRGRLLRRGVR